MQEEWRTVKNYEGRYEVSNFGRIRSLERVIVEKGGVVRKLNERIMKTPLLKSGYPHVALSKNDKLKTFYIHRIVAEAFIPNPQNKLEVNHIDGDKANNLVSNLEWVTPAENMKHSYDAKLRMPSNSNKNGKLNGEKNHVSKITEEDVKFIRENSNYNNGSLSTKELADKFGVDPSTVLSVIKNETWRHVGALPKVKY